MEKPVSVNFSAIGSTKADLVVDILGITEIDGNVRFPIVIPDDAPRCEGFAWVYDYENQATADLMEHHQQQLIKHGVTIGDGGYGIYDIQAQRNCLQFILRGELYHGNTDCCISPFGLTGGSPVKHMRIGFEHKRKPKVSGFFGSN